MNDDRLFGLVALVCVLLWLLSHERRLEPRLRLALAISAYAGIAVALAYAVVLSAGYFFGG